MTAYAAAVVLVLVAKLFGALGAWSSVVFWIGLSCAAVHCGGVCWGLRAPGRPFLTATRAVLVAALLVVPVVFDARTGEAFNVTKYTALVVAVALLIVLWLADKANATSTTWLRNGLQWPVLGLLAWALLSTVTSVSRSTSLVGAYGSYDGLVSLGAYVIAFFVVADAFRGTRSERVLASLYTACGGAVVLYGLLQLHDASSAGGHRWDWVRWGSASFKGSSIWATFGNPNHLAGFLAVLLPIGIVLMLASRNWWERALIAAIGAAAVVELAQTLTRGAWLAVLVGLPVLALAAAPEIRRRPVVLAGVVGVLVAVVVVAGVLLGSTRDLRHEASRLLKLGGGNTAQQRVEMWSSAVEVARDHPLTGTGPDTFELVFPRYQTARFVKLYGPNERANGPHNIFMNYLATTGFPGLALFALVVVLAGRRVVVGWRRLRVRERDASGDTAAGFRRRRLVLGGLAAAITAYLVQASFDVQQLALSLVFWVLLGLVVAMSADAGDDVADGPAATTKRSSNRRTTYSVAAVLATVLTLVALIPLTGPYRAELSYGRAARREKHMTSPDDAARVQRDLRRAISADSREPMYRQVLAAFDLSFGLAVQRSAPAEASALITDAVDSYRQAVRVQPHNPYVLQAFAELLDDVRRLPGRESAIADEEQALRGAVRYNPWRGETSAKLADVLVERHRPKEAVRVIDRALRRAADNVVLVRSAAEAHAAAGDAVTAKRLWRTLLRLKPDDTEAAKALSSR